MDAHSRGWTVALLTVLAVCTLALSGCGGEVSVGSSGSSASASGSPPPTSSVSSVTIAGNPATTATAGTPYSFQPTASGSGTVTYSIAGQPSWASFNASTGALTGTPSTHDEGVSGAITITASNGSSTASLSPFTIKVNAPASTTSGSASLSWVAPTTNADGSALTNLAGYHIYYGTKQSSLSQTVDITSPTATSYVIVGLSQGTYYFSIVAYNSAGVDSTTSNLASKTI